MAIWISASSAGAPPRTTNRFPPERRLQSRRGWQHRHVLYGRPRYTAGEQGGGRGGAAVRQAGGAPLPEGWAPLRRRTLGGGPSYSRLRVGTLPTARAPSVRRTSSPLGPPCLRHGRCGGPPIDPCVRPGTTPTTRRADWPPVRG